MLIQLVKKDFLIVKKYVLIMFAVCVIFPLFLIWRSPEYAGIVGFVLITIFSIFRECETFSVNNVLEGLLW